MNQYIITEEQMIGIHAYLAEEANDELRFAAYDILDEVRSHPYDPQAEREKAIYSLEYHLPKQISSIKKRQLAYKDFEENGESWCSLPDSPMLEDGDIIQIIRQEGKVEK